MANSQMANLDFSQQQQQDPHQATLTNLARRRLYQRLKAQEELESEESTKQFYQSAVIEMFSPEGSKGRKVHKMAEEHLRKSQIKFEISAFEKSKVKKQDGGESQKHKDPYPILQPTDAFEFHYFAKQQEILQNVSHLLNQSNALVEFEDKQDADFKAWVSGKVEYGSLNNGLPNPITTEEMHQTPNPIIQYSRQYEEVSPKSPDLVPVPESLYEKIEIDQIRNIEIQKTPVPVQPKHEVLQISPVGSPLEPIKEEEMQEDMAEDEEDNEQNQAQTSQDKIFTIKYFQTKMKEIEKIYSELKNSPSEYIKQGSLDGENFDSDQTAQYESINSKVNEISGQLNHLRGDFQTFLDENQVNIDSPEQKEKNRQRARQILSRRAKKFNNVMAKFLPLSQTFHDEYQVYFEQEKKKIDQHLRQSRLSREKFANTMKQFKGRRDRYKLEANYKRTKKEILELFKRKEQERNNHKGGLRSFKVKSKK